MYACDARHASLTDTKCCETTVQGAAEGNGAGHEDGGKEEEEEEEEPLPVREPRADDDALQETQIELSTLRLLCRGTHQALTWCVGEGTDGAADTLIMYACTHTLLFSTRATNRRSQLASSKLHRAILTDPNVLTAPQTHTHRLTRARGHPPPPPPHCPWPDRFFHRFRAFAILRHPELLTYQDFVGNVWSPRDGGGGRAEADAPLGQVRMEPDGLSAADLWGLALAGWCLESRTRESRRPSRFILSSLA